MSIKIHHLYSGDLICPSQYNCLSKQLANNKQCWDANTLSEMWGTTHAHPFPIGSPNKSPSSKHRDPAHMGGYVPPPPSVHPRYANGHDITLGKQFIDPFYSISLLNTMHMISQRVKTHKYKTYKFGIFELKACTDSLEEHSSPSCIPRI